MPLTPSHAPLLAAALALAPAALAAAQSTRPATADPGWTPVAMRSDEIVSKGVAPGGEGGQWPQGLACDSADGAFLVYATDVGGLYRSLDGGDRWEPANVGFTPRGGGGVAIDPNDPNRAIVVGANSMPYDVNGLYLTTDRAASWRPVCLQTIRGHRDFRDQVAYDRHDRDPAGLTRTVYWSRVADEPETDYADEHPALYKSTDGGETWAELPDSAAVGGSILRTHPGRAGVVYAANDSGVHVSADAAGTFATTLTADDAGGPLTGLTVSPAEPESVWACTASKMFRSDDAGATWSPVEWSGVARDGYAVMFLSASPADATRMLAFRKDLDGWDWSKYASHDGGRTWSAVPTETDGKNFLPQNARQALFAWHPTDPDVAWSFGGDWTTKTTDGGRSFHWSANGVNNIFSAGPFHFNARHPGLLMLSSQDYNGGVTLDGGATWRYLPVSGEGWGGFTYGGFAASPDVMFTGNREGGNENPRVLKVSRDGGATWSAVPSVAWKEHPAAGDPVGHGYDTSFADPAAPDVYFAAGFRSADGGATWARMDGCDGVFTASPGDAASGDAAALYGLAWRGSPGDRWKGATDVVRSTDHGATWQPIASLAGRVRDVAHDPVGRRTYVAHDGVLRAIDADGNVGEVGGVPRDRWDATNVTGVAVDPADPSVVYAAQHRNVYASSASASRSTDGGKTWTLLTRTEPLGTGDPDTRGLDGGREAEFVRVNPQTREAWFTTGCYGIWKCAPPAPPAE